MTADKPLPDLPDLPDLPADLVALVASRTNGTLTTIKRDGRPQLSQVSYAWSPGHRTLRVSTRATLAKVHNLRRDPRASMLVTDEAGWSYAVLEGAARFSEVASAPDDAATDTLVELYRTIAGQEHPDWDDYRRAMVADGRLVLTVDVERAYGLVQD
ncbi:MAG: PPOX class F420-dependent oxidoreductase [Actinomycetota bacterium]|nr:PPOX class F420-dependent oxidoreductase [Actinomycetota bacterium]